MLELQAIKKVYRTDHVETLALDDINLRIEAGEFVSIMGPSGCGKSTLLNLMGLLDRPDYGAVVLAGQAVDARRDNQVARLRNRHIGFIFQSFHLIPDLSVIENVALPLLYRGLAASERRHRTQVALERVGLGARMRHRPSQLSGGQQQRVAIARAIVGHPDLLLADEPTGNLDSRTGSEIMALMQNLHLSGTTVVMVTHDEAHARETGRIIRLADGRIVA